MSDSDQKRMLSKAETLIEALPYFQRYAGRTFVVKYGGHAMGDADAAQVTTEFAPANTALYANTLMGVQGTGGSTAMANSWQQYREAGATARAMLVAAAAETWGVDPAAVTVAGGRVSAGNNSATFGGLAEAAARQTVPGEVTLKSPDQWVYIGKSFPRVDVARKTEGSTGMFGMDARIEGMVHAVSLRSPRFGGTLAALAELR